MVNLIKNYLPIRISLPSPKNPSASEDTFLFVKQHVPSGSSLASSSSRTLFIANAPSYPNVRTSIILQTLFERYGDVDKVTVAKNARKQYGEEVVGDADVAEDMTVSMFKKEISALARGQDGKHHQRGGIMTLDEHSWFDEGNFAHVVFNTSKIMKKVWNQLNGTEKKKNKATDGIIKFGKLEMQELEDVSYTLYQKEKKRIAYENQEDDDEEESEHQEQRTSGISNLIQAKKASIPSRETLKAACDEIMEKYEESEEEALRQQMDAKNQPDDDGFVTISYTANVGDIAGLEQNGTLGSTGAEGSRRRKEAMKRNRSSRKNIVKGSDQLKDFYRFQFKESKKRGMEDLRNRFQEDLKRVKKMKDDKMYRPF